MGRANLVRPVPKTELGDQPSIFAQCKQDALEAAGLRGSGRYRLDEKRRFA
jgi:hypothetical protein